MYSCTHSLTSALNVGGWSPPRPGRFTPGKVLGHVPFNDVSSETLKPPSTITMALGVDSASNKN